MTADVIEKVLLKMKEKKKKKKKKFSNIGTPLSRKKRHRGCKWNASNDRM